MNTASEQISCRPSSPLPPDIGWITIAPHVGGANDSAPVRYDRLIATQLSHLAAGERYDNIVWGPLS